MTKLIERGNRGCDIRNLAYGCMRAKKRKELRSKMFVKRDVIKSIQQQDRKMLLHFDLIQNQAESLFTLTFNVQRQIRNFLTLKDDFSSDILEKIVAVLVEIFTKVKRHKNIAPQVKRKLHLYFW